RSMELWFGCVAGALSDDDFVALLGDAGFEIFFFKQKTAYEIEDAKAFLVNTGLDADRVAAEVAGRVGAAFVRATKPGGLSADVSPVASSSRSCGCADDCCA